MSDLNVCSVFSDREFAALIEAEHPEIDLAIWVSENRDALERLTTDYPVLLFRGFKVANDGDFVRVRQSLIPTPAEYLYRSTPRSHVDSGVMTATEYPANQEILQHCENAYQARLANAFVILLFGSSTNWRSNVAVRRIESDAAPRPGGCKSVRQSRHLLHSQLSRGV